MVRVIQLPTCSLRRKVLIRTTAILSSLVFAGVLLLFLGHNPISVYGSILEGGLGSSYRFKETLTRMIPLALTSLGIGLSFRMKFWNIGGEGQIMMGAFGAAFVGLNYSHLPQPLVLTLMGLAGIICGGLWALLPAFLKVKYRTNETILTLMLNYVALKWITYIQYVAWRDPEAFGYPKIPNLESSAQLPRIFGIHIGIILVPLLVLFMYLFITYTKKGYEIRVIGENELTAQYAGMPVKKIILSTLFVSGGICGLVGMIQIAGVNRTLSIDVSNNVGYTAIIISWLAQLDAIAILAASFLFAVMVEGGSYIQTVYQIPQAAASLLQGLILFFVLGSEFFIKYQMVFTSKKAERLLLEATTEPIQE
ncbi:MAG: ABC transporter permease [Spirochaetia bacterium]|nr:ABC transporter permease [Spirochaetia bacterium]